MSRVSFAWITPSWLMLLFADSVYTSRGRICPAIHAPDENPPRKNSSAIRRSDPAQYGQEPCIDRAVSVGAIPTARVGAEPTRYCRLPNRSVCCVVGSDHRVRL